MYKEANAKIEFTCLTVERGFLTGTVGFAGEGWGQGLGMRVLYMENKPGDFAGKFIHSILHTVGVEKWEQLVGRHVRLIWDKPWGDITHVGHIIKDKWLDVSGELVMLKEKPKV